MRTEDACIVQECLNGESEAFGILVDKYKAGIYAYVYSKLGDFQDSEDVTQEVFLEAYRGLRTLRRWESFSFWLYRIARNLCGNSIRARSKKPDREYIEDQDVITLGVFSINSYRENQMDESLREALGSLSEGYREVLMLRYFGGMNSVDIARSLGTSPTAVRKRLSRARAQLREEMSAMMDTAFEGQRLPATFTFRIVETVKRIRINPMPRMAGLPWGLSAAVGIVIAVLSLNPQMNTPADISFLAGSPLLIESKVSKTGEMPVDILKTSQISVIASKQDNGAVEPVLPESQNTALMIAHAGHGNWTKKADMPTSRSFASTCAMDGKIYVIGGYDGREIVSTVEEYDPATDTWTKKTDMPTPRYVLAVSAVNGKIYAIGGGFFEKPLSAVEEYDPTTDTWTKKADMPIATENVSGNVVNGKVYIIGGIADKMPISTVQEYDPATDTWARKTDMPTPRESLTSVVNGKIYVIGGERGPEAEPASAVEEYDPTMDIWRKKADMPIPKACAAISTINGKIYVIGGSKVGIPWGPDPIVQVYDPVTDKWTTAADIPTARHGLSSSVVNGKIYTIGGSVTGLPFTPVPTVEEFNPSFVSVEAKNELSSTWGEVKSQ